MPTLLDRIGERLLGYISPKEKEARAAPETLQYISSLLGGGIPPPLKAGEGLKVYQRNPWVFAAINAIMAELTENDLLLRRAISTPEGIEYEQILEHQALDLLKNPIPSSAGASHMNGGQHLEVTWIHLTAAGEAIWAITDRLAGIPREMHILMPQDVQVKLGADNLIKAYTHTVNAHTVTYEPQDIVHFKRVDPTNLYRGQSNLLASGVAIDTDEESDKYLWNFFKNRAIPDAVILRKDAPSKDEIERFRTMWNGMYRGGGNAGKLGMLWGGMDLKQLTQDNTSMQFKELKEYNRDVIMASQRVGKGIIGMMEDQSRANAEAQEYVFAKRVIRPLLRMFTRQLTADYLPQFGIIEGSNWYLEFYTEDNVPKDMVAQIGIARNLFDMGAVSINEVRTEFGYDAREEEFGDTLWGSISRVPLSDEEEMPDTEVEGEESEVDDTEDEEQEQIDDTERMIERAKNDEFSDLLKKYGSIDNVPLEKLDDLERARLKKYGIITGEGVLLESAKEVKYITRVTGSSIEYAYGVGVDLGLETFSNPAFTAEAILNMAHVREAIQKANLDMALRSLKATKIDLMRIMDKGIIEGWSNDQLAKAISARYGNEYNGYRSLRIARTETTAVANAGSHEVLKREGVKTKQWIATMDDRTREDHLIAHEETQQSPIPLDQDYIVGGERAAHPGAETLSPAQRINCRCAEANGELDNTRAKQYGRMFLRSHSSAEKKVRAAVRRSFREQKQRVLSQF